MAKASEDDSPLEVVAETIDSQVIDAFRLLSDETRLAILLTLWEAYEPKSDSNEVPFSKLFDQVEYDNAGNFSYHLQQLQGQFIRKGPEGYSLRKTGLEIVKSVIGGAGVQDRSLEPTEIDRKCELCGAATTVSYDEGVLYHRCCECDGITTEGHNPDGYLNSIPIHPTGLAEWSPGELIGVAEVAAYRHMRSMYEGLCSACSGRIQASMEICHSHDDTDGPCPSCGRAHAIWTHFRCRVCKDHHITTPSVICVFHPAVIAFYYEHGVTPRWHAADFDGLAYVGEPEPEHEMFLLSDDPCRIAVRIALEDEELQLTFDDSAKVVDVSR